MVYRVIAPLLAALVLVMPAARAATPDRVQLREFVTWTPSEGARTVAIGDARVEVEPAPCALLSGKSCAGEPGSDPVARVTLRQPGMPPVMLTGVAGSQYRFAVGPLRTGSDRLGLILTSFTGGAHCCTVIDIAMPANHGYQTTRLGRQAAFGRQAMFDAELGDFPKDVSGDGIADFVLTDDAFLYQFSSYAGSEPPPVVLSVRDGHSVDLSAGPSVRAVFVKAMARARADCLQGGTDVERNGACAGYVADAARVGRFAQAWREMLGAYDHDSAWGLTECHEWRDAKCLRQTRYRDYPSALAAFLRRNGYLPAARASRRKTVPATGVRQ